MAPAGPELLQAVRADGGRMADEWARRMVERGFAPADADTLRDEAGALVTAVVDAAARDAHPPAASIARHVVRVAELRATGSGDPYEIVEALDLLCELLHESLGDCARSTGTGTAAALADGRRLARACRSLVASVLLMPATPPPEGRAAGPTPENGAGSSGDAEFVRRLAHDLKNPLGTAMGAAETLTDASALDSAEQREQFAAIIIRNISRAVDLIEDARRERRPGGE